MLNALLSWNTLIVFMRTFCFFVFIVLFFFFFCSFISFHFSRPFFFKRFLLCIFSIKKIGENKRKRNFVPVYVSIYNVCVCASVVFAQTKCFGNLPHFYALNAKNKNRNPFSALFLFFDYRRLPLLYKTVEYHITFSTLGSYLS